MRDVPHMDGATNPYYFISNLELLQTLNPKIGICGPFLPTWGPLLSPKFWDLWSLWTWGSLKPQISGVSFDGLHDFKSLGDHSGL
jgi:hypothetical protein